MRVFDRQHGLMATFFRTSTIALKNLETFFVRELTEDILMVIENLHTSSKVLGFVSLANKAQNCEQTLRRERTVKAQKFAGMVSDLVFELRRCELEWIRKQEASNFRSKPLRENIEVYAVCIRRW